METFRNYSQTRLVICGAQADFDLDRVRTNLTFLPNETFTEFYIRTQHIINEYDMNTRGERVPITKITDTFINELSRAPVYVPYLARYQTEMVDHVLIFGDPSFDYLPPISPSEIHEILIKVKAPSTPPSLNPSCDLNSSQLLCQPTSSISSSSTSSSTTEVVDVTYPKDLSAVISILQQTTDPDCENPVLCFQSQPRSRCKACLVGYHEEVDCYARGPEFLPPKLRQRIMVYNQTHGAKPPPDHTFKDYNPKGVTPEHSTSKYPPRHTSKHKRDVRPFSNYHTKSKKETASIRSFQLVDNELIADPPNDNVTDDIQPTINSFLQTQTSFVDQIIENDRISDDTVEPVICSMDLHTDPTTLQRAPYVPSSRPRDFTPMSDPVPSAQHNTPQQLQQLVAKAHQGTNTLPSKNFIRQFAKGLSSLNSTLFNSYCRMDSHCDQGANVGSVVDMRYFLFYIPRETSVQQVGGDMIHSPGWGGVLYRFDGRLYLQAPTYFCPRSPQNTFSPGCFKNYSNFKKVLVDTNESITLIDDLDNRSSLPFMVNNGLDYVDVEVMSFASSSDSSNLPTIAAISNPVRRSPRLHNNYPTSLRRSPRLQSVSFSSDVTPILPKTVTDNDLQIIPVPETVNDNDLRMIPASEKVIPVPPSAIVQSDVPSAPNIVIPDMLPFPKHVMEKIATFYVLLHKTASPRNESIRTMNDLLGNTLSYSIPPTLPLQSVSPI